MKKLCLLLAVLIFSGCAHAPTEKAKQEAPAVRRELSAAAVAETIVKGKTTKKEVVAIFGPPNSIARNTRRPSKETLEKATEPLSSSDRTMEFWNYWTVPPLQVVSKIAATNGMMDVFRLMIYFDEKGVVVDYQAEDSKVNLAQ